MKVLMNDPLRSEKEADFDRIDLIENLLPVYEQIVSKLAAAGAKYIQIDEPYLALDIDAKTKELNELQRWSCALLT